MSDLPAADTSAATPALSPIPLRAAGLVARHARAPASPTMSQPSIAAGRSLDLRTAMPRTSSIDSSVSSASSISVSLPRPTATTANRVPADSVAAQDVAAHITAAGSPEAAVRKLLAEKNQAASHNAQLWRLVEKQRAMILGLNKDLEKSLKEKERYRAKLKDHLTQSQSEPLLLHAVGPTPLATDLEDPTGSAGSRDTSNVPSSILPDTPQSGSSLQAMARPTDLPTLSIAPIDGRTARTTDASSPISPSMTPITPLQGSVGSPSAQEKSPFSSPTSPSSSGLAFSTSKQATRKAPPAPLQLASSARQSESRATVSQNIIDPSDSEYEEEPDSARAEQMSRGRRKTREEDDRDREEVARQVEDLRSRSSKDKQSKSKPPSGLADNSVSASSASRPRELEGVGAGAVEPAALHNEDLPISRLRAHSDISSILPKSVTAPSLINPGLPMSPRPGDRPLNSPMPRAPTKNLNSIMSPRPGGVGLPLSPRAPRQPIPMPPSTTRGFGIPPHLVRAESYPVISPYQSMDTRSLHPDPSPEYERAPMTPGDVYRGFVTEQYPGLLLPPNALPLIYVKTASSRMKPSRQSYVAPRPGDENPVFTLAVHERAENGRQLWRVEKTYAALCALDTAVKAAAAAFRDRLPDKVLFTGHAPAKIDARRIALDTYVGKMMEAVVEERAALFICKFLSTDAFGAPADSSGDYFHGAILDAVRADTPVNKQRTFREGYLTKRGKNFGGWKARYFVLDGPQLKYFDDRGGAQLGSIRLPNAQIGKQSNKDQNSQEDEDNQFRHAFLVLEPKKKDSASLVRHVLCAESDEERDAWVDALLQFVDASPDEGDSLVRGGGVQILKTADLNGPRSPRLQKSMGDLRPPSHHQSKDLSPAPSDHLRAVGYSDTVPGEAPIMGNLPARKLDTPSPVYDMSFANVPDSAGHPAISGPTNLQAIPNDWKMPPTPLGKDKKRGLFSQLRGRSSSDLNEKGGNVGPTAQDHSATNAPRAVFGVPLAEAVEVARPVDAVTELPAVVYRCIEYLEANNAVAEEGIFRLSGSNTVIKGLKDRFNTDGDVNLVAEGKYYDVHAVASLLKLYLRELPSSILTRDLHLEFLQCLDAGPRDKIVALNAVVNRLPTANYALLQALSAFLLSIVENADVNKMNVRNVGIVFAPTLNVPAPLISAFVEEQAVVFGPPLAHSSQEARAPPTTYTTSLDLRSPRKQMFQDLPTPAYNQTTFSSLTATATLDDTGLIPMHPSYTPSYRIAPQGDGAYSSLNDALRAPVNPSVYVPSNQGMDGNNSSSSVPSTREVKGKRRESSLLGPSGGGGPGLAPAAAGPGPQKKPSLSSLREERIEY